VGRFIIFLRNALLTSRLKNYLKIGDNNGPCSVFSLHILGSLIIFAIVKPCNDLPN
jgi:hypothetical protein